MSPLTTDQARAAEERATAKAEELKAQLAQAEQEQAAAAATTLEADRREGARLAHLEQCKAEFLKIVDPLQGKKIATSDGWKDLAKDIRGAQRAFYAAASGREGAPNTEKMLANHFCQGVTNEHPTSLLLVWLAPLLLRDA